MRGSLAALTSVVDRTFVSRSVYEAIRIEKETLKPMDRVSLLPNDLTEQVRRVIRALADDHLDSMAAIRTRINEFRVDLLKREADAIDEKRRLIPLVETMNRALGPHMSRDLRAGRLGSRVRLGLIQDQGEGIFARDLGIASENVLQFRSAKPLLLRQVFLMFRNAMNWAQHGGIESATEARILNDRLDSEYVLVASFFDTLLTRDGGAAEADEDLRSLLDDGRRAEFKEALRDYEAGIPAVGQTP